MFNEPHRTLGFYLMTRWAYLRAPPWRLPVGAYSQPIWSVGGWSPQHRPAAFL